MQTTNQKQVKHPALNGVSKISRGFTNPPTLTKAEISEITQLPRELQYTGFIELSKAKQNCKAISNLLAYASVADYRDLAEKKPKLTKAERRRGLKLPPITFQSFDDCEHDEGYSLKDKIAAKNPEEYFEALEESKHLIAAFDEQSEKILDMVRKGGASLGRSMNRSPRRGQQIQKANKERFDSARRFKEGKNGAQGGLFGFDGGMA